VSTEHPIYLDGEPCKFVFADRLHLGHPPVRCNLIPTGGYRHVRGGYGTISSYIKLSAVHPYPMFDRRDDSNRWSNIGYDEEMCELKN